MSDGRPTPPGLAALRDLVDRLGRPASATAASAGDPPRAAAAWAATPPPLKTVAAHRERWTALRVEQRLHEARASVPREAGPLHSARLVDAALQALHRASPAYLAGLVGWLDTLMWIDDTSVITTAPPSPPTRESSLAPRTARAGRTPRPRGTGRRADRG